MENLSKQHDFQLIVDQGGFRVFRLGKLLIISFSDYKFLFNTVIHELSSIIVEKPISFSVTSSTGNKSGVVSIGYNIVRSFAEGTMSGSGVAVIK